MNGIQRCIVLTCNKKQIEKKIKLPDSGVPIGVEETNGAIKVLLGYGMADNGPQVGKQYTLHLIIDPFTLQVKSTERMEGNTHNYFDKTEKIKQLETIYKEKRIPHYALEYSKENGKAYTLRLNKDSNRFFIDVFDVGISIITDSIVLPKEKEILGLSPLATKDVKFLKQNNLVCLFHGKVILGQFEPAYLAIVNSENRFVDFIKIGSNLAWGTIAN